jgi:hypothetical protein
MTTTQYRSIAAMPEMITSQLRELQWSIAFYQREYAEAGEASITAWKYYNQAIDEGQPREQIEDSFAIAAMFDDLKSEAWHKWDEAKATYLARLN